MKVRKRDGSTRDFKFNKIEAAVENAFKACSINFDDKSVDAEDATSYREKFSKAFDTIISINYVDTDTVPVEEIQDIVEKILCSIAFKVGKAYILYREQHKQARLISEKLKYIHKYTESSDTATNLSNTDDNANSNKKNVASAEGEVYKDINRLIQRGEMKRLLAKINSQYRDQYTKDLEHHIIYQHDEASSPVLKPYCSAYTLYPLLVDGTNNVDGTKNKAPKHLSSFCGQFQNLVFLLSAQKKGAGAYGEFFNFFSYFCEKEWGENYYEKEDVVITNEHCLEQKTIGQTIDQYFQSITHYINQPAQNRGYQSPLN